MPTQHQINLDLNQALDIVDRFHAGERTGPRQETMRAELLAFFAQIEEWTWDPEALERELIRPLDSMIYSRYGYEVGPRLLREFLLASDLVRERRMRIAV
ncbi:hypothetical protein [Singulisphaera sp. PoT]|uniref:hypothetical protein n=1 Tax=Singulisphaera sp. PoT TaxID=3411797 RepID=UPI003BF5262F